MYGSWKYVYAALFVGVAFITLFPMLTLVFGSFWGAPPGAVGSFTLKGYVNTLSDSNTYKVFFNSFFIAVVKTPLAVAVGVFLAWAIARTDTPGKRVLEVLVSLPFFIPPILTALAWSMLGNPRTGLINQWLMLLPGIDKPLVNVYSLWGIIWHMTQYSAAFVFMMVLPAFRNMDPSLEDSSRMSGANTFKTMMRVTFPIMKPAILGAGLLTFIRALESFESPVFFGLPANIHVFTTNIYTNIMQREPPRYAEAMALSVFLMLITLLLVVVQWKILGRREYTTITGKGFQPRLIRLGRVKWVTFTFCMGFFVISVVLPLSQLILSSFFRIFGFYTPEMFTLNNYSRVLSDPVVWRALKNTLILGGGAAIAAVAVSSLIAYFVNRTKLRGRKVLDFVAWLPWTVPGTVLGLGMLWGYILLPAPFNIYGTVWILLLAYITKGLPLGTRQMTGTVVQVSPDLEECSRVHGASRGQTLVRIIAALIRPGFLAATILLFFMFMRDLSSSILLYSFGSEVMPVVILKYWQSGGSEVVSVIALLMLVVVLIFRVLELYLRRAGLAK